MIDKLKFSSLCPAIDITATKQRGIPTCYKRFCPYHIQDPADSCKYYILAWQEQKVETERGEYRT